MNSIAGYFVLVLAISQGNAIGLNVEVSTKSPIKVEEWGDFAIEANLNTNDGSGLYWLAPPGDVTLKETDYVSIDSETGNRKTTIRVGRVSRYRSGTYSLVVRETDESKTFNWTVIVQVPVMAHFYTEELTTLNVGIIDSTESSRILRREQNVIWEFNGCDVEIKYGSTEPRKYDQCKEVMAHDKVWLDDEMLSSKLDVQLMNLLLLAGAKPNSKNREGWTALHAAVDRNDTEAVRLLLDYGADINAITNDGTLPLNVAKIEAIKSLLISQGGQSNPDDIKYIRGIRGPGGRRGLVPISGGRFRSA
ncbi:uncharacterized protein [Periplaneta americana]|uniref:uncharacterized protein n=1 Tax=Periplaneta americana TaxID=6978 RepID=UPI0037E914AF